MTFMEERTLNDKKGVDSMCLWGLVKSLESNKTRRRDKVWLTLASSHGGSW